MAVAELSRNNATKTGPGRPPVAYQFKPGNPGRPKGSRNKLGEAFIEALHSSFKEHGADVILRVIKDKPEQFLKVVAAVIPQEINHTMEDYDQLGDDELRAAFIGAAGAIQARIEARRGDPEAGAGVGGTIEPD